MFSCQIIIFRFINHWITLNLHQSSRMACLEKGCMWPTDQITSSFWPLFQNLSLLHRCKFDHCVKKRPFPSIPPFHCPCQAMLCLGQPSLSQAVGSWVVIHVFDIHLSSCSMPFFQHIRLELSHIWPTNFLVLGPEVNLSQLALAISQCSALEVWH